VDVNTGENIVGEKRDGNIVGETMLVAEEQEVTIVIAIAAETIVAKTAERIAVAITIGTPIRLVTIKPLPANRAMLTAHEPMRVAARRDMALGKSISPGPSIATPGVLHSTPTTIRKMGRLDGCHGKNRRLGVFLKYLVSYFVTCIRPALVSSGLFCLD